MPECKYRIPVMSTIDLRTGESDSSYTEVTKEQYREYLKPLAEILADGFVRKFMQGEFNIKTAEMDGWRNW